jgi:outer membrane immunogenic protein
MFKPFALAVLAAGAIVAPAQAKDAGFGGVKIGAIVGYDNANLEYEGVDADKGGALYGVTAGYDMDLGRAIVGVEVEAADASTRWRTYDIDVTGDSAKLAAGRDLYVGARVGLPISGSLLAYAKGGYTNARAKLSYNDGAGFTASDSDTLDGWRAGGGVELSNAGTFARLEYRYSDYGDYKYAGFNTGLSVSRQQVALTGGFKF